MITTKGAMVAAQSLTVMCGGCAMVAKPDKVLGIVLNPQWPGVNQYAIVEYRCATPDCGVGIQLEVDV